MVTEFHLELGRQHFLSSSGKDSDRLSQSDVLSVRMRVSLQEGMQSRLGREGKHPCQAVGSDAFAMAAEGEA